ncbi:MAG: response regulator [Thermomicrobiales bacterium]
MERSILVVDDDHTVVALLIDLLNEAGYRVRSAFNGLAALTEIARAAPDLVLTDMRMPHLNGVGLVGRLRLLGWMMPVVFMSAGHSAADVPGFPFVAKPFDVDVLLNVITHALGNRRGAGVNDPGIEAGGRC